MVPQVVRVTILTVAVWAAVPALAGDADGRLRATIDGRDVPPGLAASVVVRQDLDRVDAATIRIRVQGGRTAGAVAPWLDRLPEGAPVDVSVGPAWTRDPERLFDGEIVGVEPAFDAVGQSQVVVRALNRLHRLTRGRKTRPFLEVSDGDIARAIADEHGLQPQVGLEADLVRHARVVQHDQTDLQFLRERAARVGFEVWVEDETLRFDRPTERPELRLGDALRLFHPRLAAAEQVQQVIVRGWNPTTQTPVVGEAAVPVIRLDEAPDPTPLFGRTLACQEDPPPVSAEEATRLAREKLEALTVRDVSAEAATPGNPGLRAGTPLGVEGVGARFDGKYYVVATSHEYDRGADGGYRTLVRVQRRDRAWFYLPEVGDDVLVAFESGDLRDPVVVGSLWADDDRPPPADDPSCAEEDGR